MVVVKFYDNVADEFLKFAVIISKTDNKWVFCKHKERETYDIPVGHREPGESILETAKSDLQEDYTVVEKQVDHEKMQYNQMEKLYFRKQAGIFALQLKEDQPCPNCGSLHHPHPAQIEKEDITKEKLDQQAKKVKQQESYPHYPHKIFT